MKKANSFFLLIFLTIVCNSVYSDCPLPRGPCAILAPENIQLAVKANFDKALPGTSLHLLNYCSMGSVKLEKSNPSTIEKFHPELITFVLCRYNQVLDECTYSFSNNTNLYCIITEKINCKAY